MNVRKYYIVALIVTVLFAAAASADEPPEALYVTEVSNYTPEHATRLGYLTYAECERARVHNAYSTPCLRYELPHPVPFDPEVMDE